MCKHCKVEPVATNKKLYCSEECSYNFHRVGIIAKRNIKNKIEKDKILNSITRLYATPTDVNKNTYIIVKDLPLLANQAAIYSVSLRNLGLKAIMVERIKPREVGAKGHWTYKMASFNLNQVEEAIALQEDKYMKNGNTTHRHTTKRLLVLWELMETYLRKQNEDMQTM